MAEYTYDTAMQALRAASAAGDIENAQKLAVIANKLKPTASATANLNDTIEPMSATPQQSEAPTHPINSAIALALSGGKYGSLQDMLFNGETPEPTMLGKLGQVLDASGVQGLTGIGPVGQTAISATKAGPAISKVTSVATAPIKAAGNIAGTVLNQLTTKDGNSLADIFRLTYQNNPKVIAAFDAGLKTGNPDYWKTLPTNAKETAMQIFNYTKSIGPHITDADAMKAIDTTKNAGGSWDVSKKVFEAEDKIKNLFPRMQMSTDPVTNIITPNASKQAATTTAEVTNPAVTDEQALHIGRAFHNILPEITIKDLLKSGNLSNVIKMVLMPSPRLAAEGTKMLATAAKKAQPAIEAITPAVKNTAAAVSVNQALGALGTLNQ